MDVAKGEALERELDAMIERRSKHKEPEEESELWKESVRRYNARRRQELRLEWHDYFCRLAGYLRTRAQEYDERAQALMEEHPKGAS